MVAQQCPSWHLNVKMVNFRLCIFHHNKKGGIILYIRYMKRNEASHGKKVIEKNDTKFRGHFSHPKL